MAKFVGFDHVRGPEILQFKEEPSRQPGRRSAATSASASRKNCDHCSVIPAVQRTSWLRLSAETFRPIQTPIFGVHIRRPHICRPGETNLAANLRILATFAGATGLGTATTGYRASPYLESVVPSGFCASSPRAPFGAPGPRSRVVPLVPRHG